MFGQNTDGFLALLGTPNGADSARLLMQHKRQLGHKTIFQAVVVGRYPDRWLYNGPDVIFEIRDVSSSASLHDFNSRCRPVNGSGSEGFSRKEE